MNFTANEQNTKMENSKTLTDLELLQTLGDDNNEPQAIQGNFEAKDFVAEVLSLAGLDQPTPIDVEFQCYVISNDHCYTTHIGQDAAKPVEVRKNNRQRKPTSKVLEAIPDVEQDSTEDEAVNSSTESNKDEGDESDFDFNVTSSSSSKGNRKKKATPKKTPKPKKSEKMVEKKVNLSSIQRISINFF